MTLPTQHHAKVSIITVCYNILEAGRKDYFLQMFASVHNQTHPNIEHIIVDGASTDGTVQFIQQCIAKQTEDYSKIDSRNSIIFQSEPDTGIYNAMNKGIHVATGEYIIFMNTDDYYATTKAIEILVEKLEKQSADLVYGEAYLYIDTTRSRTKKLRRHHKYFACAMVCHNTMLCKKNVFTQYGYFDEQYKIAADYNFFITLCLNNLTITSVANPALVAYRNSGASATQTALMAQEKSSILQLHYKEESALSIGDMNLLAQEKRPFSIYKKIFYIQNPRIRKSLFAFFHKQYLRSALKLRFLTVPLKRIYSNKVKAK